jgi:hypothetical protein
MNAYASAAVNECVPLPDAALLPPEINAANGGEIPPAGGEAVATVSLPGSVAEDAERRAAAGQAAFAEHVAAIRGTNDALHIPRLRLKPLLVTYGTAATAAGAVWTDKGSLTAATVESVAVFAVAACAVGKVAIKGIKKNQAMARERINEGAQEKADAYYELYQTAGKHEDGTPRMAMRWYGPRQNKAGKTGGELLYQVATMAKEQGIDELVIDTPLAAKTGDAAIALPGTECTTAKWLRKQKGMTELKFAQVSGRAGRENIQAASPQEWIDFAIESNPSQAGLALRGYLQQLKKLNADHPAVTTAGMYSDATMQRDHLVKALNISMRRQLEEKLPVPMNMKRGDMRRGQHQGSFIHMVGEKVDYYVDGKPEAQSTLDKMLRIYGPAELKVLEQYLKEPQKDPRPTAEQIRTLEYVIYKTALNNQTPFVIKKERDDSKKQKLEPAAVQPFMVQRELAAGDIPVAKGDRITHILPYRGLLALGTAAFFGIGLLGSANHAVDSRYDSVRHEAAAEIAKEHGVDPARADISDKLIDKRLAEWSSANTAWSLSQEGRDNAQSGITDGLVNVSAKVWGMLPGIKPPETFHLNISGSTGGSEAGIGNVPKGHETDAVWQITPHNLDPAGFWADGTSWVIGGKPAGFLSGADMHWDTDRISDENGALYADRVRDHFDFETIPTIEVSRDNISPSEIITDTRDKKRYLRLPVRDGLKPVALLYNTELGRGTHHVVRTLDGTYALRINDDDEPLHKVTYWLQEPKNGGPMTAIHGVKFKQDGMYGNHENDPDYSTRREIQKVLNDAIPGYRELANDPDKQTRFLAEYISTHYSYDKQPLSKNDLKHIKNWADFARMVVKNQEANCNVASTLVALQGKNTSVTTGFQNKKNGTENKLEVQEAHMEAIDQQGVFDPTPSNVRITTDVAHAKRGGESKDPVLPYTAVLGLLFAAAAIVNERKRITHVAKVVDGKLHTMVENHALSELDKMHISTLVATAAVAGQINYGRTGEADLKKVLRQATDGTISRERATQLVTSGHVHSRETRQAMRARPNIVTPPMRRAARLAGRVAQRNR